MMMSVRGSTKLPLQNAACMRMRKQKPLGSACMRHARCADVQYLLQVNYSDGLRVVATTVPTRLQMP
jgi:hypothetical protein